MLSKLFTITNKRQTLVEKYSIRLGYFASALMMISPHLLPYGDIGYITYVIGGLVALPQVLVAKQWNLVAINVNVFIAYSILLFR